MSSLAEGVPEAPPRSTLIHTWGSCPVHKASRWPFVLRGPCLMQGRVVLACLRHFEKGAWREPKCRNYVLCPMSRFAELPPEVKNEYNSFQAIFWRQRRQLEMDRASGTQQVELEH